MNQSRHVGGIAGARVGIIETNIYYEAKTSPVCYTVAKEIENVEEEFS
jgi:hypothetical protein